MANKKNIILQAVMPKGYGIYNKLMSEMKRNRQVYLHQFNLDTIF